MHQLPAQQRAKDQTVGPPFIRSARLQPWLISSAVLLLDQLTKVLVSRAFHPGESVPLAHPILYLTYVQNTGAAFGLFKGHGGVFISVSILVIAWLAWEFVARPPLPPVTRWGCALVLGGATGNLIDRLRFGYVVDFIDLRVWPVFNLGDSAITVGVTLLLWHSLTKAGSDPNRER